MGSYRTANRRDRARALVAALVVHLALGAFLLAGLGRERVIDVVDRLQTFDISDPPPPPPIVTAEPDVSGAPLKDPAPADLQAQAAPVAAPEPQILLPPRSSVRTAEEAGLDGQDRDSGAADRPGRGTGAGGHGTGLGGGGLGGTGAGPGAGGTPARLVRNLGDRDYRGLAADRLPQGRASVLIRVDQRGRASNCRIAQSSGDQVVDAAICTLVERRLRFRPATDSSGNPVATELTYVASWRR